MRLARVLAALLGTACTSSRPGPVTAGAPVTADSAAAVSVLPPPAGAPVSVPEARRLGVQQTLCGEHAECVAQKVFSTAGTDGDARLVVLVREKFSVSSGDASHECQGNEVWVVREGEDGSVIDRQLIGSGCAEDFSYSAACDAVISIQPPRSPTQDTVVVAWEGPGPRCGGTQRASGDIEVSLESFAVIRRSQWHSRTIGPDDSVHTYLDFSDWSFKSEWQTSGACKARKRGPFFDIPKLELGKAFLDGGWRTASMDQCATTIDSRHSVAFQRTAKSTAVLRAVVSETDALFVDVAEGAHGTVPRELQICFAEYTARDYNYCVMPLAPDCLRVALDGHVLAGKATIERAPDTARFRVQLPPETSALSVSIVEAGLPIIGSSAYLRGDTTSLGRILSFSAEAATCQLDGNRLRLSTPPRDPERALLDAVGPE